MENWPSYHAHHPSPPGHLPAHDVAVACHTRGAIRIPDALKGSHRQGRQGDVDLDGSTVKVPAMEKGGIWWDTMKRNMEIHGKKWKTLEKHMIFGSGKDMKRSYQGEFEESMGLEWDTIVSSGITWRYQVTESARCTVRPLEGNISCKYLTGA